MINILFFNGFYHKFPFGRIFSYLREKKLANAYFLTKRDDAYDFGGLQSGFIGIDIDDNIFPPSPFVENCWIDYATRVSKAALSKVNEIEENASNIYPKIDVILANDLFGPPYLLFGETKIPIITYTEFYSYMTYGYDPDYPPNLEAKGIDKIREMLIQFNIENSQGVITPMKYTLSTYPKRLRTNMTVLADGFNWKFKRVVPRRSNDKYNIAYIASSVSAAKGFELFIKVMKRLKLLRSDIDFHVIGSFDRSANTYGFEYNNIPADTSYLDHVLNKLNLSRDELNLHGYIPNTTNAYKSLLATFDIVLWPLQFGSNNHGLFEIMAEGKIVIASDRSYIPEVITHKKNGFICKYEDVKSWVSQINEILNNIEDYNYIGVNAQKSMHEYHLDTIAPRFLQYVNTIIKKSK